MALNDFLLFAFASLVLNLTPGADMLFVATRSTTQGTRAGILSALGIMAGCMVHVTAAVAGLSALLSTSANLFTIIKYLGAAYLLYLGLKSFFGKHNNFLIDSTSSAFSNKKIFWQAVLTNVLNPKVALFFLAFLPQFIQQETEHATTYIFILGIWFTISGTLVNILVAILFGKMGNWLLNKEWFLKWQNKITGMILFLLGVKIALSKK